MGAAPTVGVLLAEAVMDSETLAGIARTSTTLGAAVAGIPLAALAARYGRRTALGSGWLVAGMGATILIFAAISANPISLILGMLFIGVGSAVTLQSRFAATDLAAPQRRGRALSIVVWVGTLGSVIGPNLGVPGEAVEAALGLPPLSGAFVIAAVFLFAASAFIFLFLRPDPLMLARDMSAVPVVAGPPKPKIPFGKRLVLSLRVIWSIPASRLAFVSTISAHAVMVGVMTMTPVHMHHHGGSISIVGLTISFHVLGMFAFAPLVGQLADRIGSVPTIVVGFGILALSLAVNIIFGEETSGVMVGLFLLGLGWSFVTVSGSTMLTNSIPSGDRTLVQGVADTSMNTVAAAAAALAGPTLALFGFTGLSIGAALILIPGAILLSRWPAKAKRAVSTGAKE
jgi:MFS family permease